MTATDVHLRVMRHDDMAAGLRLCRLAGWNQVEADWRFFLTSSPAGCFVAEDDAGAVVGSIATIAYGDAFTWIAMVLVDPQHRRRGIGTRLMNAALDVVGDARTARLDATPAGREVYVPLGFCDEYGLQRMQRAATVRLKPDTTDERANPGSVRLQPDRDLRRMTDEDFNDVVTYDRGVFGADRRALLEMCWREAPEFAWAAADGGIVDGYVFGRHGHLFAHLGPLVARDEITARRLVDACLSTGPERSLSIDAPVRASWVEWLGSRGFALQRPFMRMRRGEARFQECLDRMFAITGPEFG